MQAEPCCPLAQRQKALGCSWEPLRGLLWPDGGGGDVSSGAWGPGAPSLLSPSALSEATRSALGGITEITVLCAFVFGFAQGGARAVEPCGPPFGKKATGVLAARPQSGLRDAT